MDQGTTSPPPYDRQLIWTRTVYWTYYQRSVLSMTVLLPHRVYITICSEAYRTRNVPFFPTRPLTMQAPPPPPFFRLLAFVAAFRSVPRKHFQSLISPLARPLLGKPPPPVILCIDFRNTPEDTFFNLAVLLGILFQVPDRRHLPCKPVHLLHPFFPPTK